MLTVEQCKNIISFTKGMSLEEAAKMLQFELQKQYDAGKEAAQQSVQADGLKTCGICGAVSNNPCPHHAEQAPRR